MNPIPDVDAQTDAALVRQWLDRALSRPRGATPLRLPLPGRPFEAFAGACGQALDRGLSLLLVVADDTVLPDMANALDLSIRPLCLVLPEDDFTAGITLRATLALMRSRLARREDDRTDVWSRQREQLDAADALWQATQAWSTGGASGPWPEGAEALFPVRIVPAGRAAHFASDATLTVLLGTDLPAGINTLLAKTHALRFDDPRGKAAQTRALTAADPELHLRGTLDAVTREIAELELELATVQGELADFTQRYQKTVGDRLVELDILRAELALEQARRARSDPAARAEAECAQARAEQSQQEQRRYREAAKEQEAVFRPTPDIKKLFRKVAQRIHPDRARNEADRTWRTGLMAEANRAYRNGDAATLHEVLAVWEEGRAQTETAPKARSSAMEHQLDLLRRRLTQIQAELDRLLASRMYELLVATRQARRQNRDLLHEMSRKLDSDIANVRATLRMFEAE